MAKRTPEEERRYQADLANKRLEAAADEKHRALMAVLEAEDFESLRFATWEYLKDYT